MSELFLWRKIREDIWRRLFSLGFSGKHSLSFRFIKSCRFYSTSLDCCSYELSPSWNFFHENLSFTSLRFRSFRFSLLRHSLRFSLQKLRYRKSAFLSTFLFPQKENVANDLTNNSTGSDNINYVKII